MFRTIGRVACIAIVAALVGGTLYFVVERASGTAAGSDGAGLRGGRAGRWQERADRPLTRGRGRPAEISPWAQRGGDTRGQGTRLPHGERGGHGEFSLGRGAGGLVVTFVQLGLVAAAVAVLQKRSRRRLAGPRGG